MINISFPDGNQKSFDEGVSAIDIAKSISSQLAKAILTATLNGETIEPGAPIYASGEIKFFTWDNI